LNPQWKDKRKIYLRVLFYTLMYAYYGAFNQDHPFLSHFMRFGIYLIMADGFAMAIIYKNYYGQTILNEVKETFGEPEHIIKPIYEDEEPIKPKMDDIDE
jgi:hypothetical protein